ncbi:hypothetical protein F5I97DRAFT_1619570 [Phlebopus sp. FC_14]|nr:hypothetical protein F5I97DRAFT_1619570 [Phlebopus sp. FC_14]
MESRSRKENGCPPVVYDPADGENQDGLIALGNNIFDKRQIFPLVKFTNGKSLLCTPTEFTVEGLKGNLEARRIQVKHSLESRLTFGEYLKKVKPTWLFHEQRPWRASRLLISLQKGSWHIPEFLNGNLNGKQRGKWKWKWKWKKRWTCQRQ